MPMQTLLNVISLLNIWAFNNLKNNIYKFGYFFNVLINTTVLKNTHTDNIKRGTADIK